MTSALKCRHQHNYRLSAYERKSNDFYPTPSELAINLAVGLSCHELRFLVVAFRLLGHCHGQPAINIVGCCERRHAGATLTLVAALRRAVEPAVGIAPSS